MKTFRETRDDLFHRALERTKGDVPKAAAIVEVHQSTLYRWITSCNLRERRAGCAEKETDA
jgi:transcriptional regulator with PAS, ATPase and Fis domain